MSSDVPDFGSPTKIAYVSLDDAYSFFDANLFADRLRGQALITLQRRGRSRGFVSPEKFVDRATGKRVHELALNPGYFPGMSDTDILAQLAHEMCHVLQLVKGTAGRRGFHNEDWADTMESIGLTPTATGVAGGARTGEIVSQVVDEGPFKAVCTRLLAGGRRLVRFEDKADQKTEKAKKAKAASHTAFVCPACERQVRGVPTSFVLCGHCNLKMLPRAAG